MSSGHYPFHHHPLGGGGGGEDPHHAPPHPRDSRHPYALYPPPQQQPQQRLENIFQHPTRAHHIQQQQPVAQLHNEHPRGKRLQPRPLYPTGLEAEPAAVQALQGLHQQQPPHHDSIAVAAVDPPGANDDDHNDDDDHEAEEDDTKQAAAAPKKKRKKDWRDYPRYDFNKSQGRKRLKASEEALQESKDALAAAKQTYDQALAAQKERQENYQKVSQEVIDELLVTEAPRPWTKMYLRIRAFYEKHGHVNMSTRASTAKRKKAKAKKKQLLQQQQDQPILVTVPNKNKGDTQEPPGTEDTPQESPEGQNQEESVEDTSDKDKDKTNEETNKGSTDANSDDNNHKDKGSHDQTATNENAVAGDEDDADAEEIGALGRWSALQRTHRNKGNLEDWKIKALDRLGFAWDARAVTWNQNYQELKEFHKRHGHVRVLPNLNSSLNRWLRFQRDNYRDFKANGFVERDDDMGMNKKRCELLEALGMDWKSHDERWIVLFHKLQQLAASQGHLRTIPAAKWQLVRFAERQRQAYKAFTEGEGSNAKSAAGEGELTPERVLLLESIQFPWTTEEDDGDEKKGNTANRLLLAGTPITTTAIEAAKLKQQQRQFKQHPHQKQPIDDGWMLNYHKVKAFFCKHHHFNYADEAASKTFLDHEIKKMQQWDKQQRRKYKQYMKETKAPKNDDAPLTKERVELLGVLGFFQPNEEREAAYQVAILRRFHAMHGHANVMNDYPDNTLWQKLADWAQKQRVEYRKYMGKPTQSESDGDTGSDAPATAAKCNHLKEAAVTTANGGSASSRNIPHESVEPCSLTWDRVYEMTQLGFNWDLPPPPKKSASKEHGAAATAVPKSKRGADSLTGEPTEENPPVKRKRGRPRKHPLKPTTQRETPPQATAEAKEST
ncbi:helicase [Seminavis robusta]|uniref:Helicase n=1 Tax=Seminavis robusta TaxID=568900 RepID=A0A9N8HJV6_9STRA|nr:helicase [Seminavis robusta]|eukprot:Sro575_g169340.1 helicase (894) ;mRNA; f:27795-30476